MVKKIRRQDEGVADEAKGRLEETADTPRDNEDEKVEGRPERDRHAVDEKKAASPGPSGA